MKKQLLLISGLFATVSLNAQQFVNDSISMTPGYLNESYYSMENGEVLNLSNQTWDLAFDLGGYGSGVRINQHSGVEVYVAGSNTDWATIDTTGMSWDKLNNSDKYWGLGALNTAAGSSQTDLGWGEYNFTTHHINASRSFVLKLADGSYKKLLIESLVSGVYTFKSADLDGGNEVSNTITKSDYTDKNFAYYSIASNTVLDREPANNAWDIVFTKYVTELQPTVFYGVTGVLTNKGVYGRKVENVDPETAIFSDYTVDSVINVVGHNWKSFNIQTYSYDIVADLSYFIEDKSNNIWQIKFERFDGSSTGKVVFGKRQVAAASLAENSDISALGVAPNPAVNSTEIVFNSEAPETNVAIIGLNGKVVYQNVVTGTGLQSLNVELSDFNSGMYIIQLTTNNSVATTKLMIQ